MSWTEKSKPTPFDNQPIEGLAYVDGDLLARLFNRNWTEGQKYPVIIFPSGVERDIWEASNPDRIGIIHLFGEMDLPLKSTRDEAYTWACNIAEQCGYLAQRADNNRLEVIGHDSDEHLILTYDDKSGLLTNVEEIRQPEPPTPPEDKPKPLFALGQIVATPGALDALQATEREAIGLIARHVTGDWGDLSEEDQKENELSVQQGFRILSAYELSSGVKVWVITEADRSATTILLPSEY